MGKRMEFRGTCHIIFSSRRDTCLLMLWQGVPCIQITCHAATRCQTDQSNPHNTYFHIVNFTGYWWKSILSLWMTVNEVDISDASEHRVPCFIPAFIIIFIFFKLNFMIGSPSSAVQICNPMVKWLNQCSSRFLSHFWTWTLVRLKVATFSTF